MNTHPLLIQARTFGPLLSRNLIRVAIVAATAATVTALIGSHFSPRAQAFSTGTGTWDDPYIITTCDEFQDIGSTLEYRHASYLLANDIDCSGIANFTTIGDDSTNQYFTGRFDGGGHTISNVTVNYPTRNYLGVFAETDGAYIKNVIFDNVTVDGKGYVGAVAGYTYNSSLTGISVINSSVTAHSPTSGTVGGVVGSFRANGNLYAISVSTTTVTLLSGGTNTYVGGIAGSMQNISASSLYSNATVVSNTTAGGIVGSAGQAAIKDAYVTGTTTGSTYVGGIVGQAGGGAVGYESTSVHSSYFNGIATSTANGIGVVGGILGSDTGSVGSSAYTGIYDSFSVGRISNSAAASGGIVGTDDALQARLTNTVFYPAGTGVAVCNGGYGDNSAFTAGECTTNGSSTYFNSSSNAPLSSWDFTHTWQTVPSSRPVLQTLPYVSPTSATSIGSCSSLASALSTNPDGWYSLSNDIDCLSDATLIPFATTTGRYFTGRLDGNGHTISGIGFTLGYTGFSHEGLGLFSQSYGAVFTDLNLAGSGIIGTGSNNNGVGALAGIAAGHPVIANVHSSVPVETEGSYAGGLVGEAGGAEIRNTSVTADVTSAGETGGVIGDSIGYLVMENTYYSGNIIGGYEYVGGLIGDVGGGTFTNVHSSGTITAGHQYVGGLVGDFYNYAYPGSFTNASSSMTLIADTADETQFYHWGGLVGEADNVDFDTVSFTGTLDFADADRVQQAGGIAGELDGDGAYGTSAYQFLNATSTATIQGAKEFADYSQIGGVVGYVYEYSGNGYQFDSISASPTISFGSISAPVSTASSVGLVFGKANSATVSHTVANGSISLIGDVTYSSMGNIGLLVGNMDMSAGTPSIETSSAQGTMTIVGQSAAAIGGLAGNAYSTDISDTYASTTMSIESPQSTYVAGFIGDAETNTITRAFSSGSLSLTTGQDGTSKAQYVGGFVGYGYDGTVTNTYSSVAIDASSGLTSGAGADWFGGFAGGVDGPYSITNSYAVSPLTLTADGTAYFTGVGGFIGTSTQATNTFTDNFSAGLVSAPAGSLQVGGFIGSYLGTETLSNNAYDTAGTGQSLCTGIDNPDPAWCTARNSSSFFYDSSNEPLQTWNFSGDWDVHGTTYPTLTVFSQLFTGGGGGGGGVTAPAVSTGSASAVADSTVTLNGTLSSTDSASVTAEGFAYGLTAAYTSTSTDSSGGFSTGSFTKNLTGLTCATSYHFRAYAMSADGTGYGADNIFTTSACPSTGGSSGRTSKKPGTSLLLQATNLISLGSFDRLTDLVTTYRDIFLGYEKSGTVLPARIMQVLHPVPSTPSPTPVLASTTAYVRDLEQGSTGDDVHALQVRLITANAGPAARALAANGATHFFGALTKAALVEFQKSAGITPAAGYFGPKTRLYIQK